MFFFIALIEEHDDLIGGVRSQGGLEQLESTVGDVSKPARHDQSRRDSFTSVAHLHVDRDQRFRGQGARRLFEQFVFGFPKRDVNVAFGEPGGPRRRLRFRDNAPVLALPDFRLFEGEATKSCGVRVARERTRFWADSKMVLAVC